MSGDESNKKGFWGTTLTRLKSVLAKTKEQVEDAEAQLAAEGDSQSATDVAQNPAQSAAAVATKSNAAQNDVAQSNPAQTSHTASTPKSVTNTAVPAQVYAQASNRPAATAIVDEDYIENLEERLIRADLGMVTVSPLVEKLRSESRGKNWTGKDVDAFLQREFGELLKQAKNSPLSYEPGKVNMYLIVGVNGVGKTTSIGKLASRFKAEGKKVLLAAGDTFRAAAESQLEIWADRAGVDIVRLADGADPGAVVFAAVKKAREENYDVLLIDTAGRLHNKTNLMDELKKMRGVISKHAGDLPLESLLVLDASTGQNGLQQAKVFTEAAGLSGVILTKLDGTAKGGVVFAIARELNIPVKLIGIGEKVEDLRDFEPELFVQALF